MGLQLQRAGLRAPSREAPLGKGEAVNYFYSLEMTYLIHSVSYLPSGLSSRACESYKHIYFFIFGDSGRLEGYAMRREGGEGEGWADKYFKASLSRSGSWWMPSHVRIRSQACLLSGRKTGRPAITNTLNEAHSKGEICFSET